uniref:T-box domain-containing protein n=1 Tax=Rhabditophanes sp. KR3021 TaxID=114890 RepID=A0AC35TZW1_9BILA
MERRHFIKLKRLAGHYTDEVSIYGKRVAKAPKFELVSHVFVSTLYDIPDFESLENPTVRNGIRYHVHVEDVANYDPPQLSNGIHVSIDQLNLWENKRKQRAQEMLISPDGRNISPALSLQITGLDKDEQYAVGLRFCQMDNHLYKFIPDKDQYVPYKVDPTFQIQKIIPLYLNDSMSGATTMKEGISFSEMVLFSNFSKTRGADFRNVILKSNCKYQISIVIGTLSEKEHFTKFDVVYSDSPECLQFLTVPKTSKHMRRLCFRKNTIAIAPTYTVIKEENENEG